jgi:hypothetical protein
MQRLRVALWLVFVVLLSGCGDDPPKATGPAALKHAPADADAVLVVPTDLQGEQRQRLNTLLSPIFRGAVARTDFSTWDSDPLGSRPSRSARPWASSRRPARASTRACGSPSSKGV